MAAHDPTSKDGAASPARDARADRMGLAACLFAAGAVAMLAWFRLGSLDVGYHVGYGRHFLETGEIVGSGGDPFLYLETAIPFVNANWGSQVIMALAERAGGAAGLIGLRLVLLAIVFACIAAIVRHFVRGWLAVAVAWLPAALAAYERFSMRPELFSYAILSLQLVVLTRGVRSWRSVAALAGLQLAWVNLHGYFPVGLGLTGLHLVGRLFARPPRGVRLLALALGLQAGVCLVNPRHIHGLVFPFKTLAFLRESDVMGGAAGAAAGSAWSRISEFQSPFSFGDQPICARTLRAYYGLLAIASLGGVALLARRRCASLLTLLALFLMSTQMRRNIAQFALAAAPLAVAGIATAVPWSRFRPILLRSLRVAGAALVMVVSCWVMAAIADGRFYYNERRVSREFGTGFSARTFPRDAVRWLAAHEALQPKLYVDYFSSSNTLPWLPRRFRLFVDTNTFAYADATLETAFDLGLARIPHAPFFDKQGIHVVLLHCGPDTQLLVRNLVRDDGNWALVYFDRHRVVFVRRIVPHVDVIRHNRVSAEDLDAAEWIAGIDAPPRAKALALGTMVNVPMSLGWWRPAAALAAEAARLAPDYHEAWHYRGVAEVNLGKASARRGALAEAAKRWEQGIGCFDRVLALRPDHAEARRYRRETREALEMLRRR